MKKTIFVLLTLTLLFLSGCGELKVEDITNFDECIAAGYPAMESYPRQCMTKDGESFTEDIIIEEPLYQCTDEQKQAEICTMDYTPTCGDDQVTYGNACSACSSGNIDTYTMGECEEPMIGGQRDSNGCLGPAGYNYDEEIQACTRDWELDDQQKQAAQIAVEEVGSQYALTVVEVISYKCEGCFDVELIDEEYQQTTVTISFWEISTDEIEYYCSEDDQDTDLDCNEEYDPVCGYDKDNNEVKTLSNSCYACKNEDVLYYVNGECANTEVEYELTIANHDSEQEIEIEISADNTLLQTLVIEPNDPSVGIPSIEVLTLSIPTDATELTVTELNTGFSESLTLDQNGGNYLKVSYGIPGSVAQGKYITIYQLDEQVMYD